MLQIENLEKGKEYIIVDAGDESFLLNKKKVELSDWFNAHENGFVEWCQVILLEDVLYDKEKDMYYSRGQTVTLRAAKLKEA